MQYLRSLLYIKDISLQTLLDIAVVLSILPHIFVLKSYMIIYLAVALAFVMKRKKNTYDTVVLFLIGLFCIVLSFFSNYNFSDFSRMQFFVSLISSLLILAITLQRVTNKISFYLIISPAMLMMLSFFFFNTIAMVFYSLFVFFVFVLLSVWVRMETTLIEVLRFSLSIFIAALPLVVILFIVFPRISYKKTDFGFRSDKYLDSAYSGSMNVNDTPFRRTGKVVMEVYFDDTIPSENELYFRGSTLYPTKDYKWEEGSFTLTKEYLQNTQSIVSYSMIVYPHGEKWLFPLGIPVTNPKKTILQKDYTLQSEKAVYEQKRLKFESALSYSLITNSSKKFLDYNATLYPRTYEVLQELKVMQVPLNEKAQRLMNIFRDIKISYTINPKDLNKSDVIDSFLFDAKNGYCTHFSSAFAIAARIVGIPSRVVSGYKASYKNRVKNYILVKQDDAHAWVELHLPQKGWTRYEPTGTLYKNLDVVKTSQELQLFNKINKQYMYLKYLVNNWVLGFDRIKQMKILDSLLNDTIYFMKFVFSLLGLVLFSFVFFHLIRSWNSADKLHTIMKILLKSLSKQGIVKKKNETMEHFFIHAEEQLGISFIRVNQLYHIVSYSKDKNHFEELKKEVTDLKQKLQQVKI